MPGGMLATFKGTQKAAALLVALGPDLASEIVRHLTERDVEELAIAMFSLEKLTEEQKQEIIEETYALALARDAEGKGGAAYVTTVLARALGQRRAQEIVERLWSARPRRYFSWLQETNPVDLANYLQNEHPQTIALVLSYLPPRLSAAVLKALPAERQPDISFRIAVMGRTPPDIVEDIEAALRRRLAATGQATAPQVGGAEYLVRVLTGLGSEGEKKILMYLDEVDPDLAAEVRKLMFVFDDIMLLDDRSLQRVLREVDLKDLALALRNAREELKQRIYKNMSTRAAETLKEEMELSGPVRLNQVEAAQQRIVAIIRRLDEAEEIVIQRDGDDTLV